MLRLTTLSLAGGPFLIMCAGLSAMSILSFTDSYFLRQGIFILLACAVLTAVSRIDFRFLKQTKIVFSFYLVALFLLMLVIFVGKVSKGAQSWFDLGGVSFQPVDLMKLALILVLAKYFSRRHVEISQSRHIVISFLYMLVPFLLVLLQPDFGSAMVLGAIWFGLVLVSGISKKHLFAVGLIAVTVFSASWLFLFKPYQKARILNFISPLRDIQGTGYNAYQSVIAVGSGGLLGKGIGYGTQSRLEYLPEYRTDFIFAAFAEEWGFVGAMFLLLLYLLIFASILSCAYKAHSNFESLFMYGVLFWLTTHLFVSVGMNIGLMPVTGIPLPFMSYGGSHLMVESLALGIIVAMSRYGRVAHKDTSRNEFLGLE